MYIHEYQAKTLLGERGIPIAAGMVATSPEQAAEIYDRMGMQRAVVKAQIHAGGRGKAGGIVPVSSRAECESAARNLLGRALITPQTGPRGLLVGRLLIQEYVPIDQEYYLGITLDRIRGCPLAVASASGGVEIEKAGEGLVKQFGSPAKGIQPFQARDICVGLKVAHELMKPLTEILLVANDLFMSLDCSLVELNPLALSGGRFLAVDAKINLDDNALFRHPELRELRDESQEDPREVEARKYGLSYVGLEGSIGCLVNGAGLAMATLDLLRFHGGEPANFLDVGGAATVDKVASAFALLAADPNVKVIFVNIFGGIVRCDLVAEGIIQAAQKVDVKLPLVVRLEGNMAEEGFRLLSGSKLNIMSEHLLAGAARKAVECAQNA